MCVRIEICIFEQYFVLIFNFSFSKQLKHQYRVTDERGPSHDKVYTVVLELGDERYSAQSKTIKGAQQLAAATALEKTNYKQPTSRTPRGVIARHPRDKYSKYDGDFHSFRL